MCQRKFTRGGHMAGRTGRGGRVVDSHYPRRAVQIHPIYVGVVCDAMLGFFVNLLLRMIRSQVTLAAVLRLARESGIERMTAVTSGTGAFGAIGIEPPHPGVRPGNWVERFVCHHFDYRSMALLTAAHGRSRTFDHFAEQIIERTENHPGISMVGRLKFVEFIDMAF